MAADSVHLFHTLFAPQGYGTKSIDRHCSLSNTRNLRKMKNNSEARIATRLATGRVTAEETSPAALSRPGDGRKSIADNVLGETDPKGPLSPDRLGAWNKRSWLPPWRRRPPRNFLVQKTFGRITPTDESPIVPTGGEFSYRAKAWLKGILPDECEERTRTVRAVNLIGRYKPQWSPATPTQDDPPCRGMDGTA